MAKRRPPATAGLEAKLVKALGACRSCSTQIEYFEKLADAAPEIAEDVAALRVKYEHLKRLAEVGLDGLDIDPASVPSE